MSTEVTFEVVVCGYSGSVRLGMGKSEEKCSSIYIKCIEGDVPEKFKKRIEYDGHFVLKLVKIVTDADDEIVSEETISEEDLRYISKWEHMYKTGYSDEE